MKKIFMSIMMVMMLAVSAICSADAGKTLSAEEDAAAKFLSGNFKNARTVLSAEMVSNWDESEYNNFQQFLAKEFGKINVNKLRQYDIGDSADRLIYQIEAEKQPQALFIFIFKNDTGRPLLVNFGIDTPKAEEAPAEAGK